MQIVSSENEDVPEAGRIYRNGADRLVHDGTSLNSNASSTASSRSANMADMCLIHSTVQGTNESDEEYCECRNLKSLWQRMQSKLQAVVYNILPPTTAITDYTVGLGKLSANGQSFFEAQMAASLEQTTQIISGISFITHGSHIAYVSTQIKQSRLN